MCSIGRPNTFFTDSQACYMGSDSRLHQCICPLTTCTQTAVGYGCTMTPSMMVLCGFMVLVWIAAAAAYLYVSDVLFKIELESKNEMTGMLSRNYYYERLFGNPTSQANSPTAAVPVSK